MKFSKRIVAVMLCVAAVALFVPAASVPTDAATVEVTGKLDFSAMPQQDNPGSSVQLIKEAGAVDAYNLYIAGNHGPVANPGGYMGEGYYVQKLDAGLGNTFLEASLDLVYWVATASPQGYLKVSASTDNIYYEEIFSQTEGNGDPWVPETIQSTTIPIPMAAGAQTVYIKVVMQHWTTWEGAAVKSSTLRGTVEKDESAAPVIPDDTPTYQISAAFDFSAMATDRDKEMVIQDLKHYGLHDCQNVQIGGNYGNVATPGGYAGEGYIVHRLSAPEGERLVSAQLDLKYWVYNSSGTNPGYLQILTSTDGQTYTELARIEGAADKASLQSLIVDLPQAAGAEQIYVKVVMQHWESFEGAAVKMITINAGVTGEEPAAEPTDPEPTVPENTAPQTSAPQLTAPNTTAPGASRPADTTDSVPGGQTGRILGAVAALACGILALGWILGKKKSRGA